MLSLLFMLLLPKPTPFVNVEMDVREPTHHYVLMEVTFPASNSTTRTVLMPNWIPGSYKIRDFARRVENFTAVNEAGEALATRRSAKDRWVVSVPKDQRFTVAYAVFANERSVRTSCLIDQYAILNPADLVVYEQEARQATHLISISRPSSWSVETALPTSGDGQWRAESYDQLVDSPILAGHLKAFDFDVLGIPHRWVVAGDAAGDLTAMVRDMHSLCRETLSLFGEAPFSRYLFLSFFADPARGGLEHSQSTLLGVQRDRLLSEEGWSGFLSLVAHEYFHAWNVKSFRDRSMLKYDYQKENYTSLLWLHEGFTSYYDNLLVKRSGLASETELLKQWTKDIHQYLQTPGRHVQSLADASFNSWIHQYQPDETKRNARVSYYGVGALAGLSLDLLIRNTSNDRKSLDDLMVHLYQLANTRRTGITIEDINLWLDKHTNAEGRRFVQQYVTGTQTLPILGQLKTVGLDWKPKSEPTKDNPTHAFKPLRDFEIDGLIFQQDQAVVTVASVLRGSAAWESGFNVGDELIAIDGVRVGARNVETILKARGQSGTAAVLLSRDDRVIEIQVGVTEKDEETAIVRMEKPTEPARKRLDRWLAPVYTPETAQE